MSLHKLLEKAQVGARNRLHASEDGASMCQSVGGDGFSHRRSGNREVASQVDEAFAPLGGRCWIARGTQTNANVPPDSLLQDRTFHQFIILTIIVPLVHDLVSLH